MSMFEKLEQYKGILEEKYNKVDENIEKHEDRQPDFYGAGYDKWEEKYNKLEERKNLFETIIENIEELISNLSDYDELYGGLGRIK